MEVTNSQLITGEISPEYLRTHIKELEDETCKIINKAEAIKITISKLDEGIGCFVPIAIIDVSEYNSGSFCNTELFQFEVT